MSQDTIAAISTGQTKAGISIIRVSGKDAFHCCDRLFRKNRKGTGEHVLIHAPSHTIHHGYIFPLDQTSGTPIDEVLVSVFKAPKSYTAEDTVEINCHGGLFVTERILSEVFKTGVRPAEPGEFTKRAFLNGRMDLTKAEAVMGIISAQNELALKANEQMLSGNVRDRIRSLRQSLLDVIALIEAALDDPEHYSLEEETPALQKQISTIKTQIDELISHADEGRMMTQGIKTVILGKPNAGKSSLMNLFLGEERAIVTDIAGTTRDVIHEPVKIGKLLFDLMDTAGIHETEDVIERIGVDRSYKALSEADLILFVADSSLSLSKEDEEVLSAINSHIKEHPYKKCLILWNKSDLAGKLTEKDIRKLCSYPILPMSAKEQLGLDLLRDTLKSMYDAGDLLENDELVITHERHKACLVSCSNSLLSVQNAIASGLPEDFWTIDLMEALSTLGQITGDSVEDEVANRIFEKFCMGK